MQIQIFIDTVGPPLTGLMLKFKSKIRNDKKRQIFNTLSTIQSNLEPFIIDVQS